MGIHELDDLEMGIQVDMHNLQSFVLGITLKHTNIIIYGCFGFGPRKLDQVHLISIE